MFCFDAAWKPSYLLRTSTNLQLTESFDFSRQDLDKNRQAKYKCLMRKVREKEVWI